MCSPRVFDGSKRHRRTRVRADREVRRVTRDLTAIAQVVRTVPDEAALQQALAQVADPAQRSAVQRLLSHFLPREA